MLQVANFLLPLVTLPYLTRVLGVGNFGLVVFVQAVMQYFVLLTGWGFSWSAARRISAQRSDQAAVDGIYSASWTAQFFLLMCSAILLALLVVFIPSIRQHADLYLWGFTAVIGSVFFPVWLLQGLEKMRAAAAVQLIARVSTLPAYFLFVRDAGDADVVVALNGVTTLLTGFLAIFWIRHNSIAQWRHPSAGEVWRALRGGASIFVSQAWVSFYTALTPILLGAIAGTSAVGVFNLADKFRAALLAALSPLSQALFPRMSYLFGHDSGAALRVLRKSGAVLVVCAAVGGIVLFAWSDFVIAMFGGDSFKESANVLKWLSPVPIVVVGSNICGLQIMLPLNKDRAFGAILGVAGGVSLLITVPMIAWQGAVGAAVAIFFTEFFVTAAMVAYLRRLDFFRRRGHEG